MSVHLVDIPFPETVLRLIGTWQATLGCSGSAPGKNFDGLQVFLRSLSQFLSGPYLISDGERPCTFLGTWVNGRRSSLSRYGTGLRSLPSTSSGSIEYAMIVSKWLRLVSIKLSLWACIKSSGVRPCRVTICAQAVPLLPGLHRVNISPRGSVEDVEEVSGDG